METEKRTEEQKRTEALAYWKYPVLTEKTGNRRQLFIWQNI